MKKIDKTELAFAVITILMIAAVAFIWGYNVAYNEIGMIK